MKNPGADTIAAIATPPGEGGIAVIRVSGDRALEYSASVFSGREDLRSARSHTAHFGRVLDTDGNVVDEVVATVFLGPNSYTGENTVEMSCHGGILVTRRILDRILQQGARHADPGEFTKRSFLNGRLDLSQAEAVADLIHARSDSAHRASVQQLEGVLSERIRSIRSRLIDSIGLLELELDFVEEDLEFVNKTELTRAVSDAQAEIQKLLGTFRLGRIYREGVKVAIVGPPNAGKSSLLNALLESNRAIVTDIPGTTRDTIEEGVAFGGLSFRLVDTAGLRETEDVVEKEGIRRTAKEAKTSDIVLMVIDSSAEPHTFRNRAISEFCLKDIGSQASLLIVLNKCDLPARGEADIPASFGLLEGVKAIRVSALTGAGIGELQQMLVSRALCDRTAAVDSSATVTSARHFDALRRAEESLGLGLNSLENNQSNEFVAVDLRNALDCLGEITGEVTTDDILEGIFAKFCIGK